MPLSRRTKIVATVGPATDSPAVLEALFEAGPGGKPERYVPRFYAAAAVARIVAPSLVRRILTGGPAKSLTTRTAEEAPAP